MGIIGISGKKTVGKDTVGQIIQYLIYKNKYKNKIADITLEQFIHFNNSNQLLYSLDWKVKKFADKLKDIICILINCTRDQLEDESFKSKELGEEWDKFKVVRTKITKFERIDETFYFSTIEEANKFKLNNLNYDYFGEIEKVEMTPRLMLQLLGTDCCRNIIHPSIWVNSLINEYDKGLKKIEKSTDTNDGRFKHGYIEESISINTNNFIITDTRFPNELEAVKKRGGITIRVNRNFEGKWVDKQEWDLHSKGIVPHESETALDDSTFDYEIDNNGTIPELIDKIRNILIENKLIKNN